jgi:EAL domain-containing protein (putative c-di-GMP-specific phosphodiesterase class I)
VRWRHPERGLLTPFHFLDVAEETGLIEEISEMVTRRALSALAIWRSMGLPAERISLNISAKELRDSSFVDKLSWDVDASGLQPCNVGIEILESVLIDDDNDPVIRNVAALSSAGFSVELDDFGTGHASIGNLKKFKVNKIKIDRSFVTDIDTLPDQQKITRAMINLAHSLDVEALVEGVETEGELRRLRAMGCDAVQGYLIGRPMAEADALAWLKSQVDGKSPYWVNGGGGDILTGGLGV